jgi:hypothetical protein
MFSVTQTDYRLATPGGSLFIADNDKNNSISLESSLEEEKLNPD